MSVTPLAVAEVTQRGRRKPTSLTLDLAGVRAAIAELQRAERVLLAAQAAADAPGDVAPTEPLAIGHEDGDEDGPMDDEAELRRADAAADNAGEPDPDPAAAAGPDGQDPLDPDTWARGIRIRKAEMLDVTGGREFFVWGDPRIDEVLAAGGTLVRTFDVLIAFEGGAVREWTTRPSHPELFLVPDGNAAAAAAS
jgi:hypothetical protein